MTKSSCAFSGHHPNRFTFGFDEDSDRCLELKSVLAKRIDAYLTDGVRIFYTGLALGPDQWAADIVLERKRQRKGITLTAVVPFETQANYWPEHLRQRYKDRLARCDDAITLHKRFRHTSTFERDRYMIERAQYLLAVYDGEPRSGVAHAVNYAKKLEREITIIHPDSFQTVL